MPELLTARELAQLRADLSELLPDTCTILRPTTGNTNGYVSKTFGTAVASTACRIDPNGGGGREVIAAREGNTTDYILTLEYNADVEDTDRIVISGTTYSVTQLFDNHSLNGVKRVGLAQIK